MNKLTTLVAFSFSLLAFNFQITAQTCCGASTAAPEITTGFHPIVVAEDVYTTAPSLSVNASSDLPTVEYLITKRNTPAVDGTGQPDTTGGGGDVILGADADGIFMPNEISRYGITLNYGDIFDLTAVGYDLSVIKTLADSLLNGVNAQGRPCCSLFNFLANFLQEPAVAGFCDSLNSAGIYNASDIDGMNEVLEIFDVFSEGTMSTGNIVAVLSLINANGNYISAECGGTGQANFLSYGINRNAKYGYDVGASVAVRKLSEVSVFMLFPNPANTDAVNVFFTTTKTVDLTINVVDAMGKTVYQTVANNVLGNISTTIPVANLASGLYIVELTDGNSSKTQKLIVK